MGGIAISFLAGAVAVANTAQVADKFPATHSASVVRDNVLPCLKAIAPLTRSDVARRDAFVSAPCQATNASRTFFYDRPTGAARLARDVAAGEVVPNFPGADQQKVFPGDALTLVVAIGNVRIERAVEALQSAARGQKLFVEDHEGRVLSVRYEATTP
jgi:hypothetical protein